VIAVLALFLSFSETLGKSAQTVGSNPAAFDNLLPGTFDYWQIIRLGYELRRCAVQMPEQEQPL
jgi:hypothetical protein